MSYRSKGCLTVSYRGFLGPLRVLFGLLSTVRKSLCGWGSTPPHPHDTRTYSCFHINQNSIWGSQISLGKKLKLKTFDLGQGTQIVEDLRRTPHLSPSCPPDIPISTPLVLWIWTTLIGGGGEEGLYLVAFSCHVSIQLLDGFAHF